MLTPSELAHFDEHVIEKLGGIEAIISGLEVNEHTGLADSECAHRRAVYGENRLPQKGTRSLFAHFMEAFEDATLLILIACAFAQLAIAYFLYV